MKCRVIRLRKAGVVIPKYDLRNQLEARGDLRSIDTNETGFNRIVKLAQLIWTGSNGKEIELLYEPHILWMNDDRFTLTGFEQIKRENQVVDFAQSWLCKLGDAL